MPQLWIVAGPNGAGKTTLADEYLAGIVPVVSPDSIAASQGLNPIQAGRAAILEQERLFAQRSSFAVDTTLSGKREIELMNRARNAGYKTNLIFMGIRKSWLWSVLLSVDEQTPTFVKACCILPKGGV